MTIPTGFFSIATQSYVGLDPLAAEAEELWGEFVATLPAGTVIDPGDEEIQEQYMEFLESRLTSIYKSEEKGALSPLEIMARDIFFEIFSIAIDMLRTLQQSMRTQSELLKFYADWQKEYTDMMSQVPIYGPLASTRILANDEDFGATKLGFADVTVRQTFAHLLEEIETQAFSGNTREITFAHEGGESIKIPIFSDTNMYWDDDQSRYVKFRLTEERQVDGTSKYKAEVISLIYDPDEPENDGWIEISIINTNEIIESDPDDVEIDVSAPSSLHGEEYNEYLLSALMTKLTEDWNFKTTDPFWSANAYAGAYVLNDNPIDAALLTFADLKELWGPNGDTFEGIYSDYEAAGSPSSAAGKREFAHRLFLLNHYGTCLWGPWDSPKPGAWPNVIESFEDLYSNQDKRDAARSASQGFRGELNAQLQLFIQNTDARKQAVRDLSEGSEAVINQIRESIQAQSQLLRAITESLRSLLSAIFR